MSKYRIGILETGRPPEELAPQHGSYPDMVRDWLGGIDAAFASYAVLDMELPEDPASADLWVVTGSKHGVYEDHPWIAPLEGFIRAVHAAGKQMFGICFGHQIIAQAMGGVVRKSEKGWGLGLHDYPVNTNWPEALGPAPQQLSIQAYHQDQVETPPNGAITVAATGFCEHAALWYPGFAVTVQGHPEFDVPYARDLLEIRRGTLLSGAQVDDAQQSMDHDSNRAFLADLVKDHLLD